VQACPEGALRHTGDHRLAARRREDLILRGGGPRWAGALEREGLSVLGRSLRLRHVGAGGWNGCEVEVNVLDTVVLDLLRFGVRFVASPRHADGILVTGPVTLNMEGAFRKAYDAVPSPKIVVAVGACAVSGGPCAGHPEARDGAAGVVPVDLWVPGCPPHPLTTLDGLLGLPGRLPSGKPPA
jgi:Ni,Fe-hydrogenase III small subunit